MIDSQKWGTKIRAGPKSSMSTPSCPYLWQGNIDDSNKMSTNAKFVIEQQKQSHNYGGDTSINAYNKEHEKWAKKIGYTFSKPKLMINQSLQ